MKYLPLIISLGSFIVAIISLCYSIKAFRYTWKIRANEKRPFLEISTSFGGYVNIDDRIPNIHIVLLNKNEKAILTKIEEKDGKIIHCSKLNKTINNNEEFEIVINSNEKIEYDDFNYEAYLYLKDVDGIEYLQILKGNNVLPEILPLKTLD